MKWQTIVEYDNPTIPTTTLNRQIWLFQCYPFIICKGMPAAGAPAISATYYYRLFYHYSSVLLSFLSSRQLITYRTAPQVRATVSTRVCICTCILSMCQTEIFQVLCIYCRVQDRRLTLPDPINPTHAGGGQATSHRTRLYRITK